MKLIATTILLPLFLIGCAAPSGPKVPDYQFPANLTVPCEDLPPMKGNTLGDLYEYTIDVVSLYNQCALRHDALSEAVKKPNSK